MHISVRHKFIDGNQLEVGSIVPDRSREGLRCITQNQMEKAKNGPHINKAGSFVMNQV